MKDATSIKECKDLVTKHNTEMLEANLNVEVDFNCLKTDLYSHFQSLELPTKNQFYIDLSPYYDIHQGWSHDLIPEVISLLRKVRFLNRFDSDLLRNMLARVTLKRVPARTVLLLQPDEGAIIIAG